ncbi:NAD-dependent epimerase/dehydratase family protein [Lentzea sp. PSKA42]|uniref:NAD-dependent epimerase/dehydratase family protein n=1 Tax=Lentzea indica TaxID=2604800 RepID=A0ABX1FW04_9PSEU|nr:NAD-dependent epimerase/dehydratase family protein [Lentzea indica]NKE62960.1 NAD-dependent epimerase/dehydratase family protein [Lentzea indica]
MVERAVVTGGAGFLGSHVCEALVARGVRVICVDDFSTGASANVPPAVELLQADVSKPFRLPPCDLVLHFACPASPSAYLASPVGTLETGGFGTHHVLEEARRLGTRVVIASTSEIYGDPLEHPQRETYWGNVNPIGPRSVYDEAKRFGEALAFAYRRQHGLDVGVIRIFNTYGPRMKSSDGRMLPTFFAQARKNEPLTVHGDGTQTRSLCYVDDLVRGVLAMADSDEAGPVNLGNPEEVTVLEVAKQVIEVTGSHSEIEHVGAMTDDPRRRRPDISRARELFGWEPEVSLEQGLRVMAREA